MELYPVIEKVSNMSDNNIEIGKSGSLSSVRKYLQFDCNMLQVWAGKVANDTDYIVFISHDLDDFAILTSPGGSDLFTIADAGAVIFMHSKNLRKLAQANDR